MNGVWRREHGEMSREQNRYIIEVEAQNDLSQKDIGILMQDLTDGTGISVKTINPKK